MHHHGIPIPIFSGRNIHIDTSPSYIVYSSIVFTLFSLGDDIFMRTAVVNAKTIGRKWYLIDADNMILGRLASKVATILSGKEKPAYAPNQDYGDYVVIVNADKVRLSGKKAEKKVYFRHSRYPSGQKFRSFQEQMALDSTKVIKDAVQGMIPKTVLGRSMLSKLHVYKGENHPHQAQKPEVHVL